MNQIHQAILSHIRSVNENESTPFSILSSLTDDQLVKRMFSNYRGNRGLRLTHFGLQIMNVYFQNYVIEVPDNEISQPLHLIFLDDKAKMPYYCGKNEIILYDPVLGTKLKLVDGRLSTLMEIEIEA